MESPYDILCIIGFSAFMGLSIWLALDIFQSSNNILFKKEPSGRNLIFDVSKNTVLRGDVEVLRIKQGSANHRFISYLFEHEDQDIPIEQLYKDLRLSESTYLKKLIANTKLPQNIRRQAFVVSESTIRFQTSFD